MKNLVTEEHIPVEETQFSLRSTFLDTDIYKEFIETRNKSKELFE